MEQISIATKRTIAFNVDATAEERARGMVLRGVTGALRDEIITASKRLTTAQVRAMHLLASCSIAISSAATAMLAIISSGLFGDDPSVYERTFAFVGTAVGFITPLSVKIADMLKGRNAEEVAAALDFHTIENLSPEQRALIIALLIAQYDHQIEA
jgi:hypothetical protein